MTGGRVLTDTDGPNLSEGECLYCVLKCLASQKSNRVMQQDCSTFSDIVICGVGSEETIYHFTILIV